MMVEQQQHGPPRTARQSHRKQSTPQRSCLDPALKSAPSPISSRPQWTTHQYQHQQPALPESGHEELFCFDVSTAAARAPPAAPKWQAAMAAAGADTQAVKGHKSGVQQPAENVQTGCDFCPTTQSPVWRNGPQQYPRCWLTCSPTAVHSQEPPQDPFTSKVLAALVRKSDAAAAAAAAAAADSEEYEPPAPRAAAHTRRNPQPPVLAPAAAPAQAAAAAAASGHTSPMQGVLGKRDRKASAKQLALEEQEQDEGHGQRTKKAARRGQHHHHHQQQQEAEEDSSDGVASAPEDRAEVGTAAAGVASTGKQSGLLAVMAQIILQEAQRQGQLPAHGLEVVECSLDSTATEEDPEM